MSQQVVERLLTQTSHCLMKPRDPQEMLKALGLLWHSSQLLALSRSVISALSNALWGSNHRTDLTQMKPFHPFNSPHGTTTTNPSWKVVLSKPFEIMDIAGTASIYAFCCITGFVSL